MQLLEYKFKIDHKTRRVAVEVDLLSYYNKAAENLC